MPDHDPPDHAPADEHDPRSASRLRRLGRKLLGEERVEGRINAREVLDAVLEGSDKAKTEVVRVIAREVRTYLDELGLREVLTNYSLEVHASFNLRKLAEEEKKAPGEG